MDPIWYLTRVDKTLLYTAVRMDASLLRRLHSRLSEFVRADQEVQDLEELLVTEEAMCLLLQDRNLHPEAARAIEQQAGGGVFVLQPMLKDLHDCRTTQTRLQVGFSYVSWRVYVSAESLWAETAMILEVDLKALEIFLADDEEVPGLFHELADLDPAYAVAVVSEGVKLSGNLVPPRFVTPPVAAQDLLPLLETDDMAVREGTISVLRSTNRRV